MTFAAVFGYGLMFIFVSTVAIAVFGSRSTRQEQRRMDAEYVEQMALYDSASRWPADGCHWCGIVDKLDHIGRCDYCAELDKMTGPKQDPRFKPFKMELSRW
jgi:hypothetical protein